MGSCVCLRQHCCYGGLGGAFQRRGLSSLFRKGVVAPGLTAPFCQYHRNRRRVEACVSTGFKEQELRSPDLVALEYADLNLTHNVSQELGHVRIRQHVNPLSSSLSVPVEVPDWDQVFRDPTLPLMVDIGSGSGRFLMWLAKRNLVVRNYLGLEIRQKLVKRADVWVKELGLSNIHFMYANATTSFNQLVSTYPGPLMLVSILCPDPYFKRKHHKRRVVQKPLVDSIVNNLAPRGQVLDEMPAMGFVPNVVTFTTILGGYVSRRDMVGAKRVFGEILDRGWFPDVPTYTILMDGYVKQGKLVEAIKVMDEMEDNGIGANEVTYGVMIEGYCKEKKSGEAVNLLNDMAEKRYIPSSTLCCKVIDVLCCEGKVEDACVLWKRLLKKNCTPDNAVLGTLIYWLCKKGEVWEARKLFDQFETSEPPDVMTYNVLISGMCEVGELCEAGRLWDDMVEKGYSPNSFTYNVLIKGFCKIGKAKEGVRILDEIIEKGCLPNKSTYAMLIEGLCDSGEEAEITTVISMAMSSGHIDSDSWELFLTKVIGDLDSGESVLNRIQLENAD